MRNHDTDLRYQAGELKDDVQRLLNRAEQVASLAITVTEQDMVSIAKVEEAVERLKERIDGRFWENDEMFLYGELAQLLEELRSEGGAKQG